MGETGFDRLLYAITEGNAEVVEKILSKGKIDPNYGKGHFISVACTFGFLDILKLLHKYGGKIADHNPLITACEHGMEDVVEYILDNGGNIDADENYPLSIAVRKSHTQVVELLLQRGVTVKLDTIIVPPKALLELRDTRVLWLLHEAGIDFKRYSDYNYEELVEANKKNAIRNVLTSKEDI